MSAKGTENANSNEGDAENSHTQQTDSEIHQRILFNIMDWAIANGFEALYQGALIFLIFPNPYFRV